MTTNLQSTAVLYDQDYQLWLESTMHLIRSGEFNRVDWENLLEELESLGNSNKRELESRLTVLLEHLLKLAYWESERENNARGWKNTVIEQRYQIRKLLKYSPSLKPFLLEIFPQCYADALKITSRKTELPEDIFSEASPFTIEQILDDDFLPIDS